MLQRLIWIVQRIGTDWTGAGVPKPRPGRSARGGIVGARGALLGHPEERSHAFHGAPSGEAGRALRRRLLDTLPKPGRVAQDLRGDPGRGRRSRELFVQGAEDHSGIQEIFERVAARLLSIGRAQAEHGVRKARLRAGRPAQKEARFDGRVAPASGALQVQSSIRCACEFLLLIIVQI